ncbi:adenosylcobinamide-GDP ribazoletransferase [Oxalicibacterium solurbis]|uniref:Adenosylcobinamide-GDP ribazoletransferase n=1 Tax=Oxalicibacterium solurbis TaxID=69280 RepID=A0A8J3AZF2_9BURK|nr:adenosylcobinamide-GDP ribazoletransferase [Oxalicibacterium solurbis]GGI54336.1 adenosylcobinamide-GDP ribazoletransferase [Oxalicibacterium solurbis]
MSEEDFPKNENGLGGRCMHQWRLFCIALQFFTRIPVPRSIGFDPQWLQQALRYFPAVGIVVALITSLVYIVATLLWPQTIAVLLSMIAGIYLTGAFHEDGFADTCDGFGGGTSAERVLEIMKDSRIGAYGAIGIMMMLALKATTLVSLPPPTVVAALLIGHPLSRWMASALVWQMEYAKMNGKAKPIAEQMSNAEFGIATAIVLLPIATIGCLTSWIAWDGIVVGVVLAAAASYRLARLFDRRIGGYTGDCLGAVQQVAEVAFYLGVLTATVY